MECWFFSFTVSSSPSSSKYILLFCNYKIWQNIDLTLLSILTSTIITILPRCNFPSTILPLSSIKQNYYAMLINVYHSHTGVCMCVCVSKWSMYSLYQSPLIPCLNRILNSFPNLVQVDDHHHKIIWFFFIKA